MRNRTKLILIFVIITVLVPVTIFAYNALLDRLLPLKYQEYIMEYSKEFELGEYLVMGVIRAESGFRDDAHSGRARGLMQLTDDTAKWIADKLGTEYEKDMILDAETNIKMGCFYLSYLIEKYNNTETALAAYNAGMGNVNSWLADSRYSFDGVSLYEIPYGETKRYVKRVGVFETLYEKFY